MSGAFGLIVPGRPVISEFQIVSETKCITFIQYPSIVSELTFFLVPNAVIPHGCGAILYYCTGIASMENWSTGNEWIILGAISPDKPSATFRTGWTMQDILVNSPMIQLGISLEPMETITNLSLSYSGVDDRLEYARKIAEDLWNYMTSLAVPNDATNSQGLMIVPVNIFDRWMERFDRKYRFDPNFMLKN